jgi:hypothetical protein
VTTYADALARRTRTPVILLELDLDRCARIFGSSPCLATGEACYNTRGTCRYLTAYSAAAHTRQYTSSDAPVPFGGPRPYLDSVNYLPTEITTTLTVAGRASVTLADEPDADIGEDPYLSTRGVAQGTYWKKLLARNPHYKGRPARLYEGFLGMTEAEFHAQPTWAGAIDNITVARGTVKIEVADLLKALDKIEVPAKSDSKLVADIDASVAIITLSALTGLDTPSVAVPGLIRIGDEILAYPTWTTGNHQITGVTRGAHGTEAVAHSAGDKVQHVRFYEPANPFDILLEMLLTDAAYSAGQVDSAAFADCKGFPGGEFNMSALISEPTKLSDLYFELVDLLDCKSWVTEDQQVTLRRNLPNRPGRAHSVLSDAASIVDGSGAVDLNQASRLSRLSLYWDPIAIGELESPSTYNRLDVAIDADAESAAEYGEPAEKLVYCRWLQMGLDVEETLWRWVLNHTGRRVWLQRDPLPILKIGVELQDAGIRTGEYVDLLTDELQGVDGADLSAICEVVKREVSGEKITLSLLRTAPVLVGYVAADAAPVYASATAQQRRDYAYLADADGTISGAPGYHLW